MNFERKTIQNQFLPILSETKRKIKNLKKSARSFQVGAGAMSIMAIRIQTHFLKGLCRGFLASL